MGRVRAPILFLAASLASMLAFASVAFARDPGRWVLTGASSVPPAYWQGLTNSPDASNVFFIGPAQGLWQTNPQLVQTAGVDKEIPTDLRHSVGYNHIGDPTWLSGGGGRIVLPMECYDPSANPTNTCGKGAFGIAGAKTLAWRYYVQLDPKFIPKAMWAETSPDGRLIWTSSGDDLIAYRTKQVTAANAAPSGPELKPAKRLKDAVPPTGVTGAVFRKDKLLLAGESNHDYKVFAVDTKTGDRRLQIETHICGESEGLGLFPTLGGRLHWLIAPSDDSGCKLTFGPGSGLQHFARARGRERFHVHLDVKAGDIPGEVYASITARRPNGKPVRGARVRFAGERAHTNRHGFASLYVLRLDTPGWFGALVRKHHRYGISRLVNVGVSQSAAPPTRPSRG